MKSPTIKNAIKYVFYALHTPRLPAGLSLDLGYIFHTERIYDDRIFERLLRFTRDFRAITGKKAICAVMSAVNPMVRDGMALAGVSETEYLNRLNRLAREATLGYHGHFWIDPVNWRSRDSELRGTRGDASALGLQLSEDLSWFERNGIDHNGIYSAGWWYMTRELQRLLLDRGFRYDFSLSQCRWFKNQYSDALMKCLGVVAGEAFAVTRDGGRLACVQNLIGCHQTPFPEDFVRHLKTLLGKSSLRATGVVNSHDYDLEADHTLNCLRYLKRYPNVGFCDLTDFARLLRSDTIKSFPWETL